MRSMKRWTAAAAATLLLGLATMAVGGTREGYNVYIGADYAFGSLGTTRNSASTVERIGCVRVTLGGFDTLQCEARNDAGKSRVCWTSDPVLIAASNAINGDSHIQFHWDKFGQCVGLYTYNTSSYGPKNP